MGIRGFEGRLAGARKERNLTQEQLAARLGVTPQAVSKWERGLGMPDIELLCGIGEVLQCSVDDLLGLSSPKITESGNTGEKNRVMGSILAEPLVLEFGMGLVGMISEEGKAGFPHMQSIRLRMAAEQGMLLPVVRIRDNGALEECEFRLMSYDRVLAQWDAGSPEAVTAEEVFGHMMDICVENFALIINREIVRTLVVNVAERYPSVVGGVIPEIVSYACLQQVLVAMIKAKKPIRNLIKIIELMEDKINAGCTQAGFADEIAGSL